MKRRLEHVFMSCRQHELSWKLTVTLYRNLTWTRFFRVKKWRCIMTWTFISFVLKYCICLSSFCICVTTAFRSSIVLLHLSCIYPDFLSHVASFSSIIESSWQLILVKRRWITYALIADAQTLTRFTRKVLCSQVRIGRFYCVSCASALHY